MIDFHSHILPGMDDGSSNVGQSIEMLRIASSQSTDIIIATPHFLLRNEPIDSFLTRRSESFARLSKAIEDTNDLPKIILGAEVELLSGISSEESLESLCIAGTRCCLLEMPFYEWNSLVLGEVRKIACSRRITPVIAHIERYFDILDIKNKIFELLEIGAVLQANAEDIVAGRAKRKLLRMIETDQLWLLGSDCHDTKHRVPGMLKARKTIRLKLGEDALYRIDRHGESILGE